jgi:hydroxylamine reductase (hybrid-cluster protein)
MIIQLESATGQNMETAKHRLQNLAQSWGHEITEAPAEATAAAGPMHNDSDKAIDPVSVAALVLSIPSTSLAVLDLADRIHKRRRAKELIDHAQQMATQQVTARLIAHNQAVEVRTLSPDQLLDLTADEDQAN